jgi:hypothetical protein
MIRLTRREKLLAAALAIFALAWSFFAFVVKPTKDRIETLKRVIPQKQEELRKLRTAGEEYVLLRDSLRDLRTKVASQRETFELLPFLESLIRQSDLKGKIATMKQRVLPLDSDYSQTIVEIEIEGLTLTSLVDFLCKVESSDVLAGIRSLYIKKSRKSKDLLDSVVEIHNPRLTQSKVARG